MQISHFIFSLALCGLLWISAASCFSILNGIAITSKPILFGHFSPHKCWRRQNLYTYMTTLPPGWQELKVPNSARKYYYNPTTGMTQWDLPDTAADGTKKPQKIELMVPEEIRDRRAELYEKVIAEQRLQDAEKAKRGPLGMKSNQSAVVLALLFIGAPLGALVILFLTGVVPNPFEVCIEGGTSC